MILCDFPCASIKKSRVKYIYTRQRFFESENGKAYDVQLLFFSFLLCGSVVQSRNKNEQLINDLLDQLIHDPIYFGFFFLIRISLPAKLTKI